MDTMNFPEEAKSESLSEIADDSNADDSKADTAASDSGSEDSKPKKRTWKKPKDKPKRPLSAYNIFFQHQRSRIVEGYTEPATAEEIVRSIEGILSKSREKRRHRKTHGRISFGDLARAIAEAWKTIDPKSKAIFDHYAEVDMRRYRREVKAWKDKKELEEEAYAIAKHNNFINSMGASFSSIETSDTNLDSLPDESTRSEPWNRSRGGVMNETLNASFSSVDSGASDFSYEPEPLPAIVQRQQEILHQQLRESNPRFMGTTIPPQGPLLVTSSDNNNMNNLMHSSYGSLHNRNNQSMTQQQFMAMGHASFSDMPSTRAATATSSFNHWNSNAGHTSSGSLQLSDALLSPSNHGLPNQVSDYSGSHSNSMSYTNFSNHTSGFNNSYSSGFHASDGLAPPSSTFNHQPQQQGHNNFTDMRYSGHGSDSNIRQQGGGFGLLDNYMNNSAGGMGMNMDIDQRSFHR